MAEKHVRTYAKQADFQIDQLMMQREGYEMVFISSNVKIKASRGAGPGARLAELFQVFRPAALLRLLTGSNNHHCRIIAVYERNR